MALRIPPGRAGRIWLVGRLEIARRGAELLDRKRQALLRERRRVRGEAEAAQEAWQQAAAVAATWSSRAAILDGAARLELLARHARTPASLQLSWRNLMGARLPTIESLAAPDPPSLSAFGGSSAAVLAGHACADAAVAAARYAVARRAELELSVELQRASRRLRALQERWIPQHEAALAQLDLVLDESQREQAARARWATRRPQPGGG
ncbi:MAG TPA: V-type ATP synthase subunit D [Solirubrobacteraceae bacterium]|nr:V-type ATP synthase subunit D [Solirubrobacteraceae bacterium]